MNSKHQPAADAGSRELYIHIPFCVKKCAYCDFLSFPDGEKEQRKYADVLLQEIRKTSAGGPVSSLFIGGGTPSVLPEGQIAAVLAALRDTFILTEDAEITIEVNPGTAGPGKLSEYRQAGINRISFGCQSFQDAELRDLGRIHTRKDILQSISMAREAGFDNLNLDLMSGIPGQTPESWADTLHQAAALSPEHISAYSLIIEEGTPFYEKYGNSAGCPPLPDEETERRMYEQTGTFLAAAGYLQYEISNYAREGCACRHNTGYWTGVPYIGMGLGASSFLPVEEADAVLLETEAAALRKAAEKAEQELPEGTNPVFRFRCSNTRDMRGYLQTGAAHREIQLLGPRDLEAEFMILGLRMTEGIEDAEFTRRFGQDPDSVYGAVLDRYEKTGMLIREAGRTKLSPAGVSVSNPILADFL